MKSIAVFIPVYNGGLYLKDTLRSILNQTYANFKIYCVDDSSLDNSLDIIQSFTTTDSRVLSYSKERGGGTAKSWNFILPKIEEDFIFYMSQDDLISSEVFEKMIIRYSETNADCILPDMVWYYEEHSDNKKIIGLNSDRTAVLTGTEALQKSLEWEIHGFALRKKKLYENEYFSADAFDTDEYMTRKLFYKSKKVAFSTGSFFYRQDNLNAITKDFTSKNYYSLLTYLRVYSILKKSDQLRKEQKDWFNFILNTYLLNVENFRNKKGIQNVKEEKEISFFLKKFRAKLLFQILSKGKFWSKFIFIKKIYFNKSSKIQL